MTTIYRIDDLAEPRLPWPVRTLNRALAPFTRWVRLDEAALLSTVMKKTGLTDFGDERFRKPLRVLVAALERESRLNMLSRLYTRRLLLQLLTTRLLVQDLVIRHPEILALPVPSPIVILGLPRTGTTHLHNLLSCDPHLRTLPYWESLQPVLPPGNPPAPGRPDPRVKRCQRNLRLLTYMMPLYPLMHEMACDLPQEEIQLLAVDFSTMLFEWNSYVPGYRDWYCTHDQTHAYRYLRKLLQVLQWLRGGTRWVLKSPQHLEQLRPLLAVFPDAKIVQTHRDPVTVTASLCTMLAYVARAYTEHVDLLAVGRYWSARVEDLLRASVRDAPFVPAGQVFHVRFHEFMADEVTMVKRVYAFAEQPLTGDALRAVTSFKATNPRGRLGRIAYHLEDFGLDPRERRQALRFYQECFDVPDE
jgi:Sulfotransferase family